MLLTDIFTFTSPFVEDFFYLFIYFIYLFFFFFFRGGGGGRDFAVRG